MSIEDLTAYVRELRDEPWREHAACKGMPISLFFPEKGRNVTTPAKKVCASCPVAAECLEAAIRGREIWGVWGGCSEKQRRPMRRVYRKGAA